MTADIYTLKNDHILWRWSASGTSHALVYLSVVNQVPWSGEVSEIVPPDDYLDLQISEVSE